MRFLLFVLIITGCTQVCGQQFRHNYTINLPDSLVKAVPLRADLNNDGLLDALLITQAASGHAYLQIVKGDTAITPFLHWQATRIVGPVIAYVVTDYDHDNRLDVVISSPTGVVVYINRGSFAFTESQLVAPSFSRLLIGDLDNDGRPEWIISDKRANKGYFAVLRQTGAFTWTVANDSLILDALALELVDQNLDGRHDVFVSGAVSPDSVVSAVLSNIGGFWLKPRSVFDFAGTAHGADMNGDGVFDFTIMGADLTGTAGTRRYQSAAGNHGVANVAVAWTYAAPFVADMNSDGVPDFNYRGKSGTDTLNIVEYGLHDYDTLPTAGYRAHVFGDEDHDGDLDLLLLRRAPTRLQLLGYTNMTHANAAPPAPRNAVSLRIFDRTLFYWDPVIDDHTPQASITYDLYVDGAKASAAEFDLLNEKRLTVTHGNNGTQHFRLLRKIDGTQFAVQAIDNAFHASRLCIGTAASGNCAAATQLTLCEGESKQLEAPADALWFSFARGYLGRHTMLDFQSNANDTLFYFDPAQRGCGALKIWTVGINNNAIRGSIDRYACRDQPIALATEPGWSTVHWRSYRRGDLGSGSAITYQVTETDTITATLSNAAGCTRHDKITVRISAPAVRISPDQVRIARGAAVQLVATGASRYTWTPATGLTATNTADPMASPLETTLYEVTGYDSLQCTGTAQASVIVEAGGFIPNLFTPNGDGKNDELRIYGVSQAGNFLFTIHNREGSVVYRTDNLSEAVQRGWDGKRQGTPQPAGVYFWKVKGALTTGERLLLNGKDSGSIVLVR
jgi:gliding motility-associated-like protein